jgi:hypothetical protein
VNRKPSARNAKPIASNRNPRPQAANPDNHPPGRNNTLITNRAGPLALSNRPRVPKSCASPDLAKVDRSLGSLAPAQATSIQGHGPSPKNLASTPPLPRVLSAQPSPTRGPIEAASISECWFFDSSQTYMSHWIPGHLKQFVALTQIFR